jgi:hypothetical protein
MMCDRIVSDREAAVGVGGGAGYRIKNKNPAQRCGENSKSPKHPQPRKQENSKIKVAKACKSHKSLLSQRRSQTNKIGTQEFSRKP